MRGISCLIGNSISAMVGHNVFPVAQLLSVWGTCVTYPADRLGHWTDWFFNSLFLGTVPHAKRITFKMTENQLLEHYHNNLSWCWKKSYCNTDSWQMFLTTKS